MYFHRETSLIPRFPTRHTPFPPYISGRAFSPPRAIALNLAFLSVTRTTQRLDATGTAAAAHAVALQLWQLGGVILFAVSTVASILVPSELNREVKKSRFSHMWRRPSLCVFPHVSG